MELVVLIKGNVKYPLTLDPGVWIFDDRKVDLTTFFDQEQVEIDPLEAYTKSVSEHWDREIKEGSFVTTKKVDKKYQREFLLTGTFAIPFKYFIENSEPESRTGKIIFRTDHGEISLPFEDAYNGLFGFSLNGKPLTEGGPIHFYYGDGSNKNDPIKSIHEIVIT